MAQSRGTCLGAWLVFLVLNAVAQAQSPGDQPQPRRGPDGAVRQAAEPWSDGGIQLTGYAQNVPLPKKPLDRPEGAQSLDRPLDPPPPIPDFVFPPQAPVENAFAPPLGFTGKSGVLPTEVQGNSEYVPREDRWRIGLPAWDRYGKGHPPLDDYPYDLGNWWNPYKQNVLKGDYPIIGQHLFLNITGVSRTIINGQQIPTNTTGFESTARSNQAEFFGSPNQLANQQFFILRFDLFHGDAAFKPADWQVVLEPVFNLNTANVDELAQVSPDVRKGVYRQRTFLALQEYFVETKLADTSPYYDFISARVGQQFFVSDFRGFLFEDVNRAVRIFGTALANRVQFNLAYFRQAEKDTNSIFLNTFNDRKQNLFIANLFCEDFIWPGYTVLANFHYNNDPASFKFDRNGFLVRPDPVGVFQPHSLDVFYFGFGGDGHIGRYNLTHFFYWALGNDTRNPLANQQQDISAYFFAVEGSYDRDWARFRTSFLYSSGDRNPNDGRATGFDTILDFPNFAGGQFTYFQRQRIPLFGVGLNNVLSFIPDLRSSKTQGQSNFVNPGLILVNAGFDVDLTPKIKLINNINWLWFDSSQVLQTFLFDGAIGNYIGTDLSMGLEYRPLLSNNIIVTTGVAGLIPGNGFKSIYNQQAKTVDPLVQAFLQLDLVF